MARIFLPKLGWMRLRLSREVLGTLKNATLSLNAGKWCVSIQTEREVVQPVPTATTAIGIDMGVTRFATLSDGAFYAPLNSFKKHEQRLACYQRRMSRKVKFSKSWNKAKRKVQAVHTRIGNARRDYLHKTSTTISQNPAMVSIEDLRACPCYGHIAKENRLTQARFACVDCGHEENADVVGALNVLARGHRVAACGEDGSGLGRKPKAKPASVKQEPTEATVCEVSHA